MVCRGVVLEGSGIVTCETVLVLVTLLRKVCSVAEMGTGSTVGEVIISGIACAALVHWCYT